MNSSKFDIDGYTKKLVNKGDVKQPGSGFTKNVMSRILKDPSLKVNFITKDDKQSNIWLFISIGVMIIGYIIFFFIKNGFSFGQSAENFQTPGYVSAFTEFFSKFWNLVPAPVL